MIINDSKEQTKQYLKALPRKIVSAHAIFLDEEGNVLIVKPTYKTGWIFPGGTVEHDESPRVSCIREIQEELGITVDHLRLVAIDHLPEVTSSGILYPDHLTFIFYGGVLNKENRDAIILPKKELSELKFCPPEDTLPLLREHHKGRFLSILKAIQNNDFLYLEGGGEPLRK